MAANRLTLAIACLAAVALAGAAYFASLRGISGSSQQVRSKSNSARAAVPVVTEAARTATFVVRRRTIGALVSPAIVNVRSRIDSLVTEQHVTDGQFVRKGQMLFTLDDREIKATIARDQATLAKDKAALTQTKGQYDRAQQLAAKGFTPMQQLELAESTYKAAQQTVEADQAVLDADSLRLGYAKLEAPMDGRLGTVRVAPGNLVSSGDAEGLVTITQLKPLRVAFTLPEGDLSALRTTFRQKPRATVRIFTGGSTPAGDGSLDFLDSAVDTTSGTIAARATIANEDYGLWPGQFVDVEVDLSTRPDTVMLPSTAILMGQQGPYVYIAGDNAAAELRPVKLGGTDGERTAVLDGVKPGERVVIDGQVRLTAGARWVEAGPAAARPQSNAAEGEKARSTGSAGAVGP